MQRIHISFEKILESKINMFQCNTEIYFTFMKYTQILKAIVINATQEYFLPFGKILKSKRNCCQRNREIFLPPQKVLKYKRHSCQRNTTRTTEFYFLPRFIRQVC